MKFSSGTEAYKQIAATSYVEAYLCRECGGVSNQVGIEEVNESSCNIYSSPNQMMAKFGTGSVDHVHLVTVRGSK